MTTRKPRTGRFKGRASREEQADSLKETIYVAFTLVAVMTATTAHGHVSASGLARSVVVTTAALTLTMFLAHVISHLVVHDHGLDRRETRHAIRAALLPMAVTVVPIAVLLGAAVDWWPTGTAAVIAVAVLGGQLAVAVWFAARGLHATAVRRALVAASLVAAGAAVVAVQMLAHS